jgi:acyl-CoA thioesterase
MTATIFDTATRVSPVSANRWQATTDERYWHILGPFGGWTAATLLNAVVSEASFKGDPLAITINFMAPLKPGSIDIQTRQVRANRTTAFWNAEMRQGDDEGSDAIIQAMVTTAPRRAADSFEVLRPPTVLPPEELEPVSGDGAPIWIKRLDLRIDRGMPFRDVGGTSTIGWIRDAELRPLDHRSLLMFADTPFPRTMVKYAELRMTATVSLSVYFHASADEIVAVGNDFVMLDVDARRSSGGFFDQRVHIWSKSGVLLATSEQMVWMR